MPDPTPSFLLVGREAVGPRRRSGGAGRFLLRRVAQAAFVIFGVVCVTFFVLRLVPGDPARLMVPPGSSEEVVQAIRVELGTDRPILEQFWIYLRGLARGDLGESFRSRTARA